LTFGILKILPGLFHGFWRHRAVLCFLSALNLFLYMVYATTRYYKKLSYRGQTA